MFLLQKSKLIKILIPLILSSVIITLSFFDHLWMSIWSSLNIPATFPPFDDSLAINRGLQFKNEGLNPYTSSPNDPFNYPSVWLSIYEFFDLNNPLKFKIFNFVILFGYFFVLFDFFLKNNNKYFIFIFLIFIFSTSNFLIIERLNLEIIIFCFLYLTIVNRNYLVKSIFFLASFVLKIHPVFSIFVFINNKKYFFSILLISILYLIFMREEISIMRNNMIEFALIFAYGIGSIAKALYYYSEELNYFLNESNYILFRNILVLLAAIYATLIVFIKFRLNDQLVGSIITVEEKLFLCGSGIFIGTFITSSSIDYRLLYLIFTIPLLLKYNNKKIIFTYFLCLIICFNSLHFEGGDSYSLMYFVKASIIYFLKFIIFSINCYYLGIVLNKFLDKNFFKI